MPSLGWYRLRLGAMDREEVLQRCSFALRKQVWRLRAGSEPRRPRFVRPPSALEKEVVPLPADVPPSEVQAVLDEADGILRHAWSFLGVQDVEEPQIDWHRDPLSGISAPRRFGFGINHRNPRRVGNIKLTWEKNRHHHVTLLALAFALTRYERYAVEVHEQIRSWQEQNPFLVGVNWTHPLEHGIRLIAWVWCERLMRGSRHYERLFGDDSPLWRTIHAHQWFIARTPSHGSSANNHLIGEMAGLFISASAWPVFRRSAAWTRMAREQLENAFSRQTFDSGLNREQAFAYHCFVLELGLLACAEANRAGEPFSDRFHGILRRMTEAVPALTDVGGNLPRYGDGDESMAVQLQSRAQPRTPWLMQMGRAFVGAEVGTEAEPALPAACLGIAAGQVWGHRPSCAAFPDAGVYAMSSNRGSDDEVFVVADAGPLGYLSTAAHGHADALSFTLAAGGVPLLVDPGTYCYYGEAEWRRYFRGMMAHNTLVLDDDDPAVQAGTFLWTRRYDVKTETWEPRLDGAGALLTAVHDGYAHAGVVHRRSFELHGAHLTVRDELTGTKPHAVSLRFHFAPGCAIKRVSDCGVEAARDGVVLHMTLPEGLHVDLLEGARNGGWYSPAFGERVPCCTLAASGECDLPVRFRTTLEIRHAG